MKKNFKNFNKVLKKQGITLLPYQETFAKDIFNIKSLPVMLGCRTGKTWLFSLIDNFLSDDLDLMEF